MKPQEGLKLTARRPRSTCLVSAQVTLKSEPELDQEPFFKMFHRSNIFGAAAIAECLLLLSKSTEWKPTVSLTIGSVLDVHPDEFDHSKIFGLLVTAGFPKVTT